MGLKPEKLVAIELGDPQPSFAQIKKAADVYKRPLAVFFLPQAPQRQAEVHDFRLQPGVSQHPYALAVPSIGLLELMRREGRRLIAT